jgi:hypothetical protein
LLLFLQEYLATKDTKFIAAVKESKKLDATTEALLKDAIESNCRSIAVKRDHEFKFMISFF